MGARRGGGGRKIEDGCEVRYQRSSSLREIEQVDNSRHGRRGYVAALALALGGGRECDASTALSAVKGYRWTAPLSMATFIV